MKLSEVIEKYGDCEVSDELLGMIKPKGEWEPKKGDKYCFISAGFSIFHETYNNTECDNNRLCKHNVYRTEEEAQFALDMYNFCKERSFEPDWEDCNQKKFTLILDSEFKKTYIGMLLLTRYFEPFYYPTEEAVKEVIDKYSFEELAKYYGRV